MKLTLPVRVRKQINTTAYVTIEGADGFHVCNVNYPRGGHDDPRVLAIIRALNSKPGDGSVLRTQLDQCVFYLRDYAEMLESFALGVDEELDRDTRTRIDGARSCASAFEEAVRHDQVVMR